MKDRAHYSCCKNDGTNIPELSLSCSQWMEAAGNMYLFQKEQDQDGTCEAYSTWYNDHFCFYTSQDIKDHLYDAWKADKLKFCQEHWVKLVFASLVQSGFFPPKQTTMNCNWSRTDPDIVGTKPDHLGLVFCSPWN